ncbi:MAG: glycosyltransferase family 2 protein [Vicinamibacterales bacterium]
MNPGRASFGLSMLGWALNEEESVSDYIERAGALLASVTDDYELILIDDGSTDRTWEIVEQHRPARPWLRPFRNDRNRGSGYNTKRALGLATKDYVFWQTVDWSYDISALMASLPLLDRYDVLQGVRGDALTLRRVFRHRSDSAYKGLVSWVNYRLIRVLFGLPISDYQNVTVYPRALIQGVTLESESSFTNAECLLKTWWQGATFKEVHVPFVKRQRGVGTGTRPGAIATAIRDILGWWTRWVVLGRRSHRGRGRVVTVHDAT